MYRKLTIKQVFIITDLNKKVVPATLHNKRSWFKTNNVINLVKHISDVSRTSPDHFVSSYCPLMLIKLAWHSIAMALASKVTEGP